MAVDNYCVSKSVHGEIWHYGWRIREQVGNHEVVEGGGLGIVDCGLRHCGMWDVPFPSIVGEDSLPLSPVSGALVRRRGDPMESERENLLYAMEHGIFHVRF